MYTRELFELLTGNILEAACAEYTNLTKAHICPHNSPQTLTSTNIELGKKSQLVWHLTIEGIRAVLGKLAHKLSQNILQIGGHLGFITNVRGE